MLPDIWDTVLLDTVDLVLVLGLAVIFDRPSYDAVYKCLVTIELDH